MRFRASDYPVHQFSSKSERQGEALVLTFGRFVLDRVYYITLLSVSGRPKPPPPPPPSCRHSGDPVTPPNRPPPPNPHLLSRSRDGWARPPDSDYANLGESCAPGHRRGGREHAREGGGGGGRPSTALHEVVARNNGGDGMPVSDTGICACCKECCTHCDLNVCD